MPHTPPVDLANRARHNRKHGATFAISCDTREGVVVAVGAVDAEGAEATSLSDLLRNAVPALVTSQAALGSALAALDKLVVTHARERRDDAIAASIALLAFDADACELAIASAGRHVHVAFVDGVGERRALHAKAAALGTSLSGDDAVARISLHRDDTVVASTVSLADEWYAASERTAAGALAASDSAEASAAILGPIGV